MNAESSLAVLNTHRKAAGSGLDNYGDLPMGQGGKKVVY